MLNTTIVIVGEGLAAWLTASACARALNNVVTAICVVPTHNTNSKSVDDSLGAPLFSDAMLPSMMKFIRSLEYDENELVKASGGGFALGSVLSGWTPEVSIFNPFGEVGSVLGPVNFQNLVYRFRDAGYSAKFSNYSLTALCAQAGRFTKVMPGHRGVLSFMEHGLQLDIAAYTQELRKDAIARGTIDFDELFAKPVLNESGFIEAVLTTHNNVVKGDVFIDCSGPERRLAGQLHSTKFTEWSHWLPCNRVTNSIIPANDNPSPFIHLMAMPSRCVRQISLHGRRAESVCFQSEYGTDVHIESQQLVPGYCSSPWQKNCVALGGAAATIDPSSSSSLYLLCSGVLRLLDLFPPTRSCHQEAVEFNRQYEAEIECARDYSIAHYKLNDRRGDPFWDVCRNMSIPDSLAHRIEAYENCGRVVMHDGEVVDRMNWVALFDAHGIFPKQYDVVARGLPLALINEHLASIRQSLLAAVAIVPTYATFLNQLHQ